MKSPVIVLLCLLLINIISVFAFSSIIQEEEHTMNMQLILNGTDVATETFYLKNMSENFLEVGAKTIIDIKYKGTVYQAEYQTFGKFSDLKVESYNATVTATNGKFHYSLKRLINGFEVSFETPTISDKKVLNVSDDLYLLDNNIMWNWFLIVKVLEKTKKDKLKVIIPQLSSHPMIDTPIFDLKILDKYSENNYKFYIISLVNSQIIIKLDSNGKIIEILEGAFRVVQSD